MIFIFSFNALVPPFSWFWCSKKKKKITKPKTTKATVLQSCNVRKLWLWPNLNLLIFFFYFVVCQRRSNYSFPNWEWIWFVQCRCGTFEKVKEGVYSWYQVNYRVTVYLLDAWLCMHFKLEKDKKSHKKDAVYCYYVINVTCTMKVHVHSCL